jgi:hypothetical protein
MSNRPHSLWLWLSVAFIAGVAVAFAMVPMLARTMAIAAPAGLFSWFNGHGLLPLALLSWDAVVVYGPSIALPAAVILLLLYRMFSDHRLALTMCLGAGVLSSRYWLAPHYFGGASVSPFMLPWWQQGLVVALVLALGFALGVSRIFQMTVRPGGRGTGSA